MNIFHLAIWAKELPSEPEDNSSNEFHINVWRLDDKTTTVDIGLMIPAPSPDTEIYLYLPIPKEDNSAIEISDLCGKLLENKKLRNSLFNENVHDTSCPVEKSGKTLKSGEKKFCAFPINIESQTSQERHENGTKITIKGFPECSSQNRSDGCKKMYLRFRLMGESLNRFFFKDELATSKWQNFTSNISIFDFRLNETRSLPDYLQNTMEYETKKIKVIEFDRCHCFLLCSSTDDIILAKKPQNSVRCLEADIWNDYRPPLKTPPKWGRSEKKNGKDELLIAYHWKQTSEQNLTSKDFTVLAKIASSSVHIRKFCFVFFLGVMASLLASGILFLLNYYFS